jgi:prepilin-type N-terminal cleavage/methylation domain-containing protein
MARRRKAFTFVELLFAIAVIAILIALFLGAVTKVMQQVARTETTTEIAKLAQSLGAARARYGNIEFFPSQLILYNDISKYRNIALLPAAEQPYATQTAQVFRYMFGKRFISNGGALPGAGWGVPDATVLQGSEALVFYLGGMIQNGRTVGFSTNPTNPTLLPAAAGEDRIGPFYEFRPARLKLLAALPAGSSRPYPSYLDPYNKSSTDPAAPDMPYAFFGALSPNNYNPAEVQSMVIAVAGVPTAVPVARPYYEFGSGGTTGTPTKWLNPNTFQIISAGRDRTFGMVASSATGPGWDIRIGWPVGPGADDVSNFSQTELGNPQQ